MVGRVFVCLRSCVHAVAYACVHASMRTKADEQASKYNLSFIGNALLARSQGGDGSCCGLRGRCKYRHLTWLEPPRREPRVIVPEAGPRAGEEAMLPLHHAT
eukprot:6190949-Pleurochrysis_carterae.AAC.2